MSEPLISCVVAIYNVDSYLDECISSLRAQKYKNVEIILVNDGSTDKCEEICRKHEKEDSRILLVNQVNQGANTARNTGLAQAKGEWVYFVDGDDYVKEDVFTAVSECFDKGLDIVFFSHFELKNGNMIEHKSIEQSHVFDTPEDFYELSLATMNRLGDSRYNYKLLDAVSIWNKLYRTEFLKENGITFVDKFPKTQDLSFNLMVYDKAKKAEFIDTPGYVYRINSESVSKRYQKDFPGKLDILISWYNDFYQNHKSERMEKAYLGRVLTFSRTSVVLCYCNKNNENSYAERRKSFFEFLDKYNIGSIKLSDNKGLPFKEKVLSFAIIHKMFFVCEMLTKMNSLLSK